MNVYQFHGDHSDMGSMGSMGNMGSDSGSDDSSHHDSAGMMMQMFFTRGLHDTLWFKGWTVNSSAALGGACVGLFFLAVISRLLIVLTTLVTAAMTHNAVAQRLEAREAYLSVAQGWLEESEFDDDLLNAQPNPSNNEKSSNPSSTSSPNVNRPTSRQPREISKLDDNQVITMTAGQLKSYIVGARRHLAEAPPFSLAADVPRAVMYALNAFIGYLLMLAVMTYSWAFFISIILGAAVGELLFGRFAFQTINDVSAHVHY